MKLVENFNRVGGMVNLLHSNQTLHMEYLGKPHKHIQHKKKTEIIYKQEEVDWPSKEFPNLAKMLLI